MWLLQALGAGLQVWVSFRLHFTAVKAQHVWMIIIDWGLSRSKVEPERERTLTVTDVKRNGQLHKLLTRLTAFLNTKVTPVTELKCDSSVISIILSFFLSSPSLDRQSLHLREFSAKTYGWEAITELDLWLDGRINEWAFKPAVWLYASRGSAGILFNN